PLAGVTLYGQPVTAACRLAGGTLQPNPRRGKRQFFGTSVGGVPRVLTHLPRGKRSVIAMRLAPGETSLAAGLGCPCGGKQGTGSPVWPTSYAAAQGKRGVNRRTVVRCRRGAAPPWGARPAKKAHVAMMPRSMRSAARAVIRMPAINLPAAGASFGKRPRGERRAVLLVARSCCAGKRNHPELARAGRASLSAARRLGSKVWSRSPWQSLEDQGNWVASGLAPSLARRTQIMARSAAVLAIDQGTTSTRGIVFDADLTLLSLAQREFAQHYPASGWVEHDPDDIWRTTVETARQ